MPSILGNERVLCPLPKSHERLLSLRHKKGLFSLIKPLLNLVVYTLGSPNPLEQLSYPFFL